MRSVQLRAEVGLKFKLEVLTDSTANSGMHNLMRSGRVRHLDVRWLWAQEAVQAGRLALKVGGTTENVSDVTTKCHDEERLEASMRMGGLRFTRGLQHAASAAALSVRESHTIAAYAILRTQQTELDEKVLRLGKWISRLVNPGSGQVVDPGAHQKMHKGQSSQRDLRPGGSMISNPHEHQLGVALVTCRNQTAEEQRVARRACRKWFAQ